MNSLPPSLLIGSTAISKDATNGRAGEETQIMSSLAQKSKASRTFGGRANDTLGRPPPPPSPPPSPPPPPMFRPPTPEELHRNPFEGSLTDPHSMSFTPGTRFAYQYAGASSDTTPRAPPEWQSTWSAARAISPSQDFDRNSVTSFSTGVVEQPNVANETEQDCESQESDAERTNQLAASGITQTLAEIVQSKMKHSIFGSSDEAILFRFLLDNIERLEWMNIALNNKLETQGATNTALKEKLEKHANSIDRPAISVPNISETRPGSLLVLHQVSCTNRSHGHNGTLYADQPVFKERTSHGNSHPVIKLEGSELIQDLERYIKSRPELAFVVIKNNVCEDQKDDSNRRLRSSTRLQCVCRSCIQRAHNNNALPNEMRTEQLRVISPDLKKALRGLGRCRMDGWIVGSEGDPQMSAPYLYLYHHRKEMALTLETEKGNQANTHLKLLKDWLDTNYGKEYDEADHLFREGLVSECHLSKLFKPNSVIICKEDGKDDTAYAVQYWPLWYERVLLAQIWSWEYDGFHTSRDRSMLSITYDAHGTIPIVDLEAFPVEYAPEGCVRLIVERGQRYWSMRNGTFVSYSGWGNLREDFYVRFDRGIKKESLTKF